MIQFDTLKVGMKLRDIDPDSEGKGEVLTIHSIHDIHNVHLIGEGVEVKDGDEELVIGGTSALCCFDPNCNYEGLGNDCSRYEVVE